MDNVEDNQSTVITAEDILVALAVFWILVCLIGCSALYFLAPIAH